MALVGLLAGCGRTQAEETFGITAIDSVPFSQPQSADLVIIPVDVFILDEQTGTFSSERTADEVQTILAEANQIWSEAGIWFKTTTIKRGNIPFETVAHQIRHEFDPFFSKLHKTDRRFQSADPVQIFFVQTVRGPNGVAVHSHAAVFIADETQNAPGRTLAHELGHLLSLGDIANSPRKLMHSGGNGTELTSVEIDLARKSGENLIK